MTTTTLRKAERATAKAVQAHEARDQAIREAVKTHTLAEVAAATGLTRQRIFQIAKSQEGVRK